MKEKKKVKKVERKKGETKNRQKTTKNEFSGCLILRDKKKSEERKDQQGISRRVSKIKKNGFFAHK